MYDGLGYDDGSLPGQQKCEAENYVEIDVDTD